MTQSTSCYSRTRAAVELEPITAISCYSRTITGMPLTLGISGHEEQKRMHRPPSLPTSSTFPLAYPIQDHGPDLRVAKYKAPQ